VRVRNGLACVIAAASLAVLGTGGMTAAQAAVRSGTSSPSHAEATRAAQLTLEQLTSEVMARVHSEYPTVTTLMLASGESPSGPTTTMTDVTQWEYVINNSTQGAIGSVDVKADLDGTIASVTTHAQRWGGVQPIALPVTMDPTEAYAILVEAGDGGPYQFVSLVKPLIANAHVQYHFSNMRGGSEGWAVNTDEPHTVSPILGGALGSTLGGFEPTGC
jgi:hypothetical protein